MTGWWLFVLGDHSWATLGFAFAGRPKAAVPTWVCMMSRLQEAEIGGYAVAGGFAQGGCFGVGGPVLYCSADIGD